MNQKMEKTVTVLLASAVAFSLAACGGSDGNSAASSSSTVVSSDASGSENSGEAAASSSDTAETSQTETAAFEQITAVDNEQCAIFITGLDEDYVWGDTINVNLQNKSSEITYMFAIESASVNGVEATTMFADEVAPGMQANEEVTFYDEALMNNDIGPYTDIALTFRVYDTDDWTADEVAYVTVHIYPYGEDQASKYVRESLATDTVLIDNDNATVIVTGYHEDEVWGYTADLYLINKTDHPLIFSADDVSVNGFMADPFWGEYVGAGNTAFSEMSWSPDDFEKNGITDVESISMTITITEEDTYNILTEESVTLNP